MPSYRLNPIEDDGLPMQARLTSVDLNGCIDVESAEAHFAERADERLHYFRDRYDQQQLKALATEITKAATGAVMKNPPKDLAATDIVMSAATEQALKSKPR